MKRPVVTAVFLLALVGLAGCPVYDHENNGCYVNSDCAPYYACDTGSGQCYLPSDVGCSRPSDCDMNATCAPNNQCVPGDCSFSGCVSGYHCDSSAGIWQCLLDGSGEAGSSGDAGEPGGAGGATGAVGAGGQGGASVGAAGGAETSAAGVAGAG